MEKTSKIYIAGHQGLVGSALLRNLKSNGYTNIITRPQEELNLLDKTQVHDFFHKNSPNMYFLPPQKSEEFTPMIPTPLILSIKISPYKTTSSTTPTKTMSKNSSFLEALVFTPENALSPSKKNIFSQENSRKPTNPMP